MESIENNLNTEKVIRRKWKVPEACQAFAKVFLIGLMFSVFLLVAMTIITFTVHFGGKMVGSLVPESNSIASIEVPLE